MDTDNTVLNCLPMQGQGMHSSRKLTWTVAQFMNRCSVLLVFVFQAWFMEVCLKKEIEVQEKVKTMESELKDLEQLYNEDEINKLSSHNLHSKIIKIVADIKGMKSYEKTCFDFPQKVCDDEIAYIFQQLQH